MTLKTQQARRLASQGDIYSAGPCSVLADMGESGWNVLDLDFIRELQAFVDSNCEISIVQGVVYDSVLSGDIQIHTAADIEREQKKNDAIDHDVHDKQQPLLKPGMERPNKSDTITHISARDEVAQRMRSTMWSKFMIGGFKQDDLIGFFCATYAANTPDHALIMDTDPLRPCLLQLDKLTRILHRVDVLGTHEFKFFTRGNDPMTEVEIPNVIVMGSELPTADGLIRSKIIRLYDGPWRVYADKLADTKIADHELANPTIVTIEDSAANGRGGDPDMVSSYTGIGPIGRGTTAQAAQSQAVADIVSMRNCAATSATAMAMGPTGGAAAAASAASNPRKRKERSEHGMTEYEVTAGRVVAPNHLPMPPADPLPWKQAVLESTCLMFKLPMGMLSNGDATGKSRLNSSNSSVSGHSSRVYVEAQSAMRRTIQARIGAMYSHMYRETRMRSFIAKRLENSKGKEGPTLDEMNEHAMVMVTVIGNSDPDVVQTLYREGIIRYSAYADNWARELGWSLSKFNSKPTLSLHDINGTPPIKPFEPKPPAAAAAAAGGGGGGGSSKNKNNKKKKKA